MTPVSSRTAQRPKPRRCFLLDPRSVIPDANSPIPTTLHWLEGGWVAAKARIALDEDTKPPCHADSREMTLLNCLRTDLRHLCYTLSSTHDSFILRL